jgi:hypothetical protein
MSEKETIMRDHSHPLEAVVAEYDEGRLSRRALVARLTALGAMMAAMPVGRAVAQDGSTAPPPPPMPAAEPTFKATGLDHIALSVTDVQRSREWYVRHLGLAVTSENRNSAFLSCGDNFVALFRADTPAMHHYSYALAEYDVADAEARLKVAGLEPRREGNRIYFPDPDGLIVQVARGS